MYHYTNDYISTVTKTDVRYHRSPIILHEGGTMFYLAEFENFDQLNFFAETMGFAYKMTEERESDTLGTYREYAIDRKFREAPSGGFWKKEQVPSDAKPIKALSNGSIVTCYFTNDGETITIYRPNPNAKAVYQPLNINQHIKHRQIYGLY